MVISGTENIQPKWGNRLRWFLAASLLAHLLFFYLYAVTTHFDFLPLYREKPGEEKKIVFEVIETPEQAKEKEPPEQAKLFSDKNTRAKNPERNNRRETTPFQRGHQRNPEFSRSIIPPTEQIPPGAANTKAAKKEETISPPPGERSYLTPTTRSFSREVLLGKHSSSSPSRPEPRFNNRQFSVDELGGFAFNTYNWNFAPYLLYLKKRIQQHIFPPPAFTRMGIIEGRTVLRFLISRDGRLLDLRILNYEGHVSLMKTSLNAINSSAPFRPLPVDFPEDVLEVTGTFVYNVYR